MEISFFEKIVKILNLGQLTSSPQKLTGGLTHQMYAITTDKNKYAIKILNPEIMKRPTAISNFKRAQQLELILQEHGLPIISALIFNQKKMQKIDDIYFYVYDYYQGKSLKQEQINKVHCQKISSLLVKIHQIEIKKQRYLKEPVNIDWNYYLRKIEHQEIYDLLEKNVLLLDELLEKANQAIDKIPPVLTICHRDMDSKNVLWLDDECRIIDLECLDYDSPFLEVYELALSYSGYQEGKIDYELFKAFMLSYFENGGFKILNWQDIHDCNLGMFEWLVFNLNRLITNDDVDIAFEQVILTIKQIRYYNEIKDKLMEIIKEI